MGLIYVKNTCKQKKKPKKRKEKEVFKKYKPEFKECSKKLFPDPPRPGSDTLHIPSKPLSETPPKNKKPKKYHGDMAEREEKAQEEIERKKKMTAPLYNKGGLQYIGNAGPEIIKNLGKKI